MITRRTFCVAAGAEAQAIALPGWREWSEAEVELAACSAAASRNGG